MSNFLLKIHMKLYFVFHCLGHNKLSVYGRGKTWARSDIERLLHKLTIDEFLMEDLVVTRDDITCAYIKVGAKGEDLISGRYKVQYCPTEWRGEGNLYVSLC